MLLCVILLKWKVVVMLLCRKRFWSCLKCLNSFVWYWSNLIIWLIVCVWWWIVCVFRNVWLWSFVLSSVKCWRRILLCCLLVMKLVKSGLMLLLWWINCGWKNCMMLWKKCNVVCKNCGRLKKRLVWLLNRWKILIVVCLLGKWKFVVWRKRWLKWICVWLFLLLRNILIVVCNFLIWFRKVILVWWKW